MSRFSHCYDFITSDTWCPSGCRSARLPAGENSSSQSLRSDMNARDIMKALDQVSEGVESGFSWHFLYFFSIIISLASNAAQLWMAQGVERKLMQQLGNRNLTGNVQKICFFFYLSSESLKKEIRPIRNNQLNDKIILTEQTFYKSYFCIALEHNNGYAISIIIC